MLATTIAPVPNATRYLPRSAPGTGPTSKQDHALRAELTLLNGRVVDLERALRVQFERIAQIQQQLDDLHKVLKKLAG